MFADLLTFTSRSTLVIRATPVAFQIPQQRASKRLLAEPAMRDRADV